MDAKFSAKTKTITKAQSFYENNFTIKLVSKLLSDHSIAVHLKSSLSRYLSVLDFGNVNLRDYYKLEKKSRLKQTRFFFEFELDFCRLHRQYKSSLNQKKKFDSKSIFIRVCNKLPN